MKAWAISVVATIVVMVAIDGVWLATMLPRFYAPNMRGLVADEPKLWAAVVFYLIYAAGLTALVIMPALGAQAGWGMVFLRGALFGLVAYGTYDLTNQAVLRDWPVVVTVVDMAWGTLLTGITAAAAARVVRWLA